MYICLYSESLNKTSAHLISQLPYEAMVTMIITIQFYTHEGIESYIVKCAIWVQWQSQQVNLVWALECCAMLPSWWSGQSVTAFHTSKSCGLFSSTPMEAINEQANTIMRWWTISPPRSAICSLLEFRIDPWCEWMTSWHSGHICVPRIPGEERTMSLPKRAEAWGHAQSRTEAKITLQCTRDKGSSFTPWFAIWELYGLAESSFLFLDGHVIYQVNNQ